jgi:serine/threonine protein kinase
MKQVKVVHTNTSADTWLLTRKNELRLFDFSDMQKSGTICRELFEQRALHGCVAPEVLMESSHITSAADIWALGCILF